MCRRSAVFQCPDTHCHSKKGQRIAGNLMQYMPRCNVCGREMKEFCRARDTGDQVLGLLINPSALESPGSKEFVRHQSILVCFQGTLSFDFFLSFYKGKQISENCNEFQALEGKQHHKTLPKFLIFAEELTADLELGIRYDVPGLQTNDYFQAWNVKRWVSSTEAKMCHQGLPSFQMPPSISALYIELEYVRRCI